MGDASGMHYEYERVVVKGEGPAAREICIFWNVAGPDVFPLDELGQLTLAAQQDNRTVITDDKAGTFAGVTGEVLNGGPDAHLAPTH
jgi:hypothetical protein